MSDENQQKRIPGFAGGPGCQSEFSDWIWQVEAVLATKVVEVPSTTGGASTKVRLSTVWSKVKEGQTVSDSYRESEPALQVRAMVSSALKPKSEALKHARSASDQDLFGILYKLYKEYGGKGTQTSRITALKKLISSPMAPGEEPDGFVQKKQSIFRDELQGTVKPEEVLIAAVLSNVSEGYAAVVAPLMIRDNVTVEEALSVLKVVPQMIVKKLKMLQVMLIMLQSCPNATSC